ncbi:unnamed protein product, partial [Porites evermanni]
FDENDSDIDFTGFEARRDEESDSESEETSSETSEDSTETETPWTIELSNFEVSEFSGEPGLRLNPPDDAKADHYFLKVFGEQTVDLIIDGRKRQCVNCKAKGKKTPKNYPIETKFMCQQCGVALCQDQCFCDYHNEI